MEGINWIKFYAGHAMRIPLFLIKSIRILLFNLIILLCYLNSTYAIFLNL